jgi:hypothetical protein
MDGKHDKRFCNCLECVGQARLTEESLSHALGQIRDFRFAAEEKIVPSAFYWCSPIGMKLYPEPRSAQEAIVPIPYKPPSPELMKLLEQTRQLASDAALYGSAFGTIDADGSMQRVDPSIVSGHTVVDEVTSGPDWRYSRLPELRHEGDELPPHIQAMISDYAKAWEDDIMTAGNADQVGGLKDLLSAPTKPTSQE